MPLHTLHLIGFLGGQRAYLDIPAEEAKARYVASGDPSDPETIRTFQFTDEFEVYDASPADDGPWIKE